MGKVGVVQMVSSTKVEENLHFVEQMLIKAKEESVSLILLPENFACMGFADQKVSIAEVYDAGPIQDKLGQLAKKYGIWIIAGTLPIKGKGTKVRSSSIVFDNQGLKVARYDKIHLFDVRVNDKEAHQESLTIERGNEVTVVDTPIGKVGLTVCYDLRFTELYQALLKKGAEVFTVPSAFTAITGQAHWEVLLRARAIENFCFVLAAGQGGQHENGRHTHGHSMIIEPWGRILAKIKTGVGLITAEVDLQHLYQLRQQFPCVDHHVL